MKKSLRVLCLVLAMLLFAAFALGSGSEKASENKGEGSAAEGENAASGKAEYTLSDASVKVTTDSIGSTYIEVWWSVKNTGKVNIFLESGSADIENGSGGLEDTLSMISAYPEVLKPGETGYYYEKTFYEGSAKSGLKAVPHADVEKASVDCIRCAVSDLSVKDDSVLGVDVMGRVENNTGEALSSVKVAALLFDANGKLIGADFTYLDGELAAGDKKAFECSGLDSDIKASDVAKYTVYAYPSQFNF